MTDEEIDALEGRELDALIAERLFGWVWLVDNGDYMPDRNRVYPYRFLAEPEIFGDVSWRWNGKTAMPVDNSRGCFPKYSKKIKHAWQVVEKWRERTATGYGEMGLRCEGEKETGLWVCSFGLYEAIAPTAPLAICRAALKAVSHLAGNYHNQPEDTDRAGDLNHPVLPVTAGG